MFVASTNLDVKPLQEKVKEFEDKDKVNAIVRHTTQFHNLNIHKM